MDGTEPIEQPNDPLAGLDFVPEEEVSRYHGITVAAAARMELEAALVASADCGAAIGNDHEMLAHVVDNHLMPVVEKWSGICFEIGVSTGLTGALPTAIRAEDVDPNHPDKGNPDVDHG